MSCYANTKDPEEIKRQKVEPILELGRFLGGIHCVSRAFLKLCQFEATVSALGKKTIFLINIQEKVMSWFCCRSIGHFTAACLVTWP